MTVALMNRRHAAIGLAALAAMPMHSMGASTVLAAGSDKADFITAAMEELDESEQRSAEYVLKQGIQPAFARAPRIIPFGDMDFFYIDGPLVWWPNEPQQWNPDTVRVPKGFVSDLASVPQLFWSVLPRTGRHAYAAVVHDYLYWSQTGKRSEADLIFKIAMQDLKVPTATIQTMYEAVSYGGQSAWDENAKLKAAGEKRIIKRFPSDGLISWSEWRGEPDVFQDCQSPSNCADDGGEESKE